MKAFINKYLHGFPLTLCDSSVWFKRNKPSRNSNRREFQSAAIYVYMGVFIYNSVLQCILYSFKFKIFFALSSLFLPIFFNIYLNAIWLF